jgi:hypothetical protein
LEFGRRHVVTVSDHAAAGKNDELPNLTDANLCAVYLLAPPDCVRAPFEPLASPGGDGVQHLFPRVKPRWS